MAANPDVKAAAAGVHEEPRESAASGPPKATLEGAEHLTHVLEALAALDDGTRTEDVHILQYGDSHTAADMNTGVLRRLLQARFGDGGRGFVAIGMPWKAYTQSGVRSGMSEGFEPRRARSAGALSDKAALFGLLGVAVEGDEAGAHAWTEVRDPASALEVAYLVQPAGGSFDVLVDGIRQARVATRPAPYNEERRLAGSGGYVSMAFTEGPHRVDIWAAGDGPVRIFGLALDRARVGVVVDSLGINGAQASWTLRWSESAFSEQLRHRKPDLLILAYGTNEALDPRFERPDVERQLGNVVSRFLRAAPGASCLLLGPPDLARRASDAGADGWQTWPPVLDVIAIERRVAAAAGCAFFDQMQAMGGPGSMAMWATEQPLPRAQMDHVHLRSRGYAEVATALGGEILRTYHEFRDAHPQLGPASVARY